MQRVPNPDLPKYIGMKVQESLFFALLAGVLATSGIASAAVINGVLTVILDVQASCAAVTNATLTFAKQSTQILAAVMQSAEFKVTCAQGAPYRVGLDFGQYSQGTQRRMRTPDGAYLAYEIFKDASFQTPWSENYFGQSSATGDGKNQAFKVYGRVLPQIAVPGRYTDLVRIAVIY